MGEDARRDTRRRLSVAQAADQLGVSVDAVRSRIKRGTIAHEREGGRVFVLLDTDQSRPGRDQPTDRPDATNALISQLREENSYLREENRRKDEIIMQQALTVRQITAAPSQEPPESPESAAEGPMEPTPSEPASGPQEARERPWWRRMFGG